MGKHCTVQVTQYFHTPYLLKICWVTFAILNNNFPFGKPEIKNVSIVWASPCNMTLHPILQRQIKSQIQQFYTSLHISLSERRREWARDGLGMSREQKMQMKKEKWAMVIIVCVPVHFLLRKWVWIQTALP